MQSVKTTKSETGLKRLYRGNSTARMLLDWLASRELNRETTNFDRAFKVLNSQDAPPTRARLREVFRTFEKLGLGTFIVGRRGHPTRFIWNTPLIEVGQTAQTPTQAIKVQSVRARALVKRGPGRPLGSKNKVVAHRGPGRPLGSKNKVKIAA